MIRSSLRMANQLSSSVKLADVRYLSQKCSGCPLAHTFNREEQGLLGSQAWLLADALVLRLLQAVLLLSDLTLEAGDAPAQGPQLASLSRLWLKPAHGLCVHEVGNDIAIQLVRFADIDSHCIYFHFWSSPWFGPVDKRPCQFEFLFRLTQDTVRSL